MYYSLKSFNGDYIGDYIGDYRMKFRVQLSSDYCVQVS